MNEKRNFDYKRLHPFKWYILENFPFLEDSIDVLTNYQLFCRLDEMYNEEVDTINTLRIQVEGLTDRFDNLDVQDEVNNKLDEMAESGELEEIIATYLNTNALICFDTVSDMKSAENLVDGSYARTLGYYSKNDGGSATYKIRSITNDDIIDNMFILPLINDNSLIAELIIDENINVNQLGCYGDNEHDDTLKLQTILNSDKLKKINFYPDSIYIISDEIEVIKNIIIDFQDALIKGNGQNACLHISANETGIIQKIYNYNFDGKFISNIGLKVSNCRILRSEHISIKNICQKGIYVFQGSRTGLGAIFGNVFNLENKINSNDDYNKCKDAIGIDIENTDSQIMNGNIKDFKTSIKCLSSTLIYGIHAWNYYGELVKDGNIMIDINGGARIIGCYCDGIPTMIKQSLNSQYANIDVSSSIYHYEIGDQSIEQFVPVPIIKNSNDKVNISNSTFETSFYNQNIAIANTFENLFVSNTYCSKAYYDNYYKTTITETGKGTLTVERINDVVYYKYDGIESGTSDVSFTDKIPTWGRPSQQIRFRPSGNSATNNVTITNNGEIQHVTTTAWSSGQTSYPARYGLQKYNP